MVKVGGKILFLAFYKEAATFDLSRAIRQDVTLYTTRPLRRSPHDLFGILLVEIRDAFGQEVPVRSLALLGADSLVEPLHDVVVRCACHQRLVERFGRDPPGAENRAVHRTRVDVIVNRSVACGSRLVEHTKGPQESTAFVPASARKVTSATKVCRHCPM
jgi:hypothetical protein